MDNRLIKRMGEIKQHCKTAVVAGMIAVMAGTASAAVSVTVDFATAYAFRGSTFDSFVIQPGIEALGFGVPEKYGAVLVGTWGNIDMDDNDGTTDSSEFSEIDWYASYSLPTFISGLDVFVGFIEYTYPNMERIADKEANVGIGYEIGSIAFGTTAYLGVGGDVNGDAYYDISVIYTLEVFEYTGVFLGAKIGYFDPEGESAGWNDGAIDLTVSYPLGEVWSVGASVYYIALFEGGDNDGGYDANALGMLSVGAYF